jgi:hypothetical protein
LEISYDQWSCAPALHGRFTVLARRGKGGKFKEMDEQGRSLSADRRAKAKTRSKAGQGDKGDRAK